MTKEQSDPLSRIETIGTPPHQRFLLEGRAVGGAVFLLFELIL